MRHPIYLGGLLITVGEVWLRFSPLVVVLNLLFVAAQIVRLRYEEEILERAFPEYREYRARTSAADPRRSPSMHIAWTTSPPRIEEGASR